MTERISGHIELIGLIATPIRHSKSPETHNEVFARLGLDYAYPTFEAGSEELEDAVKSSKTPEICGYNVSIPNKAVVGWCLNHLSPATEPCGAVNTVINDNGVPTGHITDSIGYMRSLKGTGIEPAGKKVTITGAGGATTAIGTQTALDGVKEASIFDRRDGFWKCAGQSVRNINGKTSCKATLFDPTDAEAFKRGIEDSYLLASATGVGMKPLEGRMVIPGTSFLRKDLIVTDVIYISTETGLLHAVKEIGCKTMDGLGMMLYQGIAAFELWTGRETPVDYAKEILDIKF